MTAKKPLGLPSAKLIAIAAAAGLIAGAAAVYVKQTGSGNGNPQSAAAAQCEGAKGKAATLSALAKGQVAAMAAVSEPRKLETVAFKGAGGEAIGLQTFAGKTVLLNLWATWCVPCREEMPALNTLQKELGNDKFEVVAVNIDTGDDEKPKTFLSDTGVDALGFYRDSSMGVFNALKKEGLAFGLPVTLLIDQKGCLIGAMNGRRPGTAMTPRRWCAARKADTHSGFQGRLTMKIWGRTNSTNLKKAVWCAEEIGLAYERIDAGGIYGVVNDPAYRARNPNGLVPLLEDGDTVLWESNTIVRYLAAKYGAGTLLIEDLGGRAQAEKWMDWTLWAVVQPFVDVFWGMVRTPEAQRDMAKITASLAVCNRVLAIADAELAKQPYLSGETFGIGDIPLGAIAYGWFGMPIERAELPALKAWYDRLTERPAYQKVVMIPLT